MFVLAVIVAESLRLPDDESVVVVEELGELFGIVFVVDVYVVADS